MTTAKLDTVKLDDGLVQKDSISALLDSALDAGEGLLRLTPTWVPRSFLHPGRRIKLNPADLYAFGADSGNTVIRNHCRRKSPAGDATSTGSLSGSLRLGGRSDSVTRHFSICPTPGMNLWKATIHR